MSSGLSDLSRTHKESIHAYSSKGEDLLPESYSLEVGGELSKVVRFLGSGGSKEVYDVEIGDERRALALPNTVGYPEETLRNWERTLREPKYTKMVRDRGFNVNELCEMRNVNFDEYSFPAIVMKRYEDHNFEIYDAKNNNGRHEFMDSEMSAEEIIGTLSPVAEDISELIENGVIVGRDSFNLCEADGELHLYLNDLGTMRMEDEDISKYVEGYSDYAIGAFVNTAEPQDLKGKELGFLSEARREVQSGLENLVNQNLDTVR